MAACNQLEAAHEPWQVKLMLKYRCIFIFYLIVEENKKASFASFYRHVLSLVFIELMVLVRVYPNTTF